MNQFWSTFLLSTVAGLATGLGGLIAIIRKPGRRSFGLLMGGIAGVMIMQSFMELTNETWEMAGLLTATLGFTAVVLFMFTVDMLIPDMRFGEAEVHSSEVDIPSTVVLAFLVASHRQRSRLHWFRRTSAPIDRGLLKTGILAAIGIAIHNLPEGIAVGAGSAPTPSLASSSRSPSPCTTSRKALQPHCRSVKVGAAVGVTFVFRLSGIFGV